MVTEDLSFFQLLVLGRTRDASCYDISPLNNCTIVETRCKLLYNIVNCSGSFQCCIEKVQNKTSIFILNVFFDFVTRPPDGHSYDRPRDPALWEHHGQIYHPAPPAQLPHRPVQ